MHEILGFDLSGEGEHRYIQIEKIGQNTLWVIDELSRQLSVDRALIGRSGLKDRHAVTRQWLSIQDPKSACDFDKVDIDGVRLLNVAQHHKKLRPGDHAHNQFRLVLRDVNGDQMAIDSNLENLRDRGFPNYFGDQRFGREGKNLTKGWSVLAARRLNTHKNKGMYLSALRAFLFNKVASKRLLDLEKEHCSAFGLTAPMWGRGRLDVDQSQAAYEQQALDQWKPLCEALEHVGLKQERRPIVVVPENFNWSWHSDDVLELKFSLPSGSYATSLLREVGEFADASLAS